MPNNQHIPARERQRIRARVSEVRRVPLSEVPYPRSNMDFYQYLLEAGDISQHQFNHIIFRHYYPVTEQSRDFRRNRINNINRILNIVPLEYRYTVSDEYRNIVEQESRIIHLMHQIYMPTLSIPVTYERIIEHHGERLAETNISLCQECLMPIVLGEELCNECILEERIIPEWLY